MFRLSTAVLLAVLACSPSARALDTSKSVAIKDDAVVCPAVLFAATVLSIKRSDGDQEAWKIAREVFDDPKAAKRFGCFHELAETPVRIIDPVDEHKLFAHVATSDGVELYAAPNSLTNYEPKPAPVANTETGYVEAFVVAAAGKYPPDSSLTDDNSLMASVAIAAAGIGTDIVCADAGADSSKWLISLVAQLPENLKKKTGDALATAMGSAIGVFSRNHTACGSSGRNISQIAKSYRPVLVQRINPALITSTPNGLTSDPKSRSAMHLDDPKEDVIPGYRK